MLNQYYYGNKIVKDERKKITKKVEHIIPDKVQLLCFVLLSASLRMVPVLLPGRLSALN